MKDKCKKMDLTSRMQVGTLIAQYYVSQASTIKSEGHFFSSQLLALSPSQQLSHSSSILSFVDRQLTVEQSQGIDALILRWFATAGIAFAAIDNPFAKQLFGMLRPKDCYLFSCFA
jgi:hypothetical protein